MTATAFHAGFLTSVRILAAPAIANSVYPSLALLMSSRCAWRILLSATMNRQRYSKLHLAGCGCNLPTNALSRGAAATSMSR